MKSEHDAQTPGATLSVAQWGNNQIPIDPALQQQSQQPTAGYYQAHQQYYQHQQPNYYAYQTTPTTQQVQHTQPQLQPAASTSRQPTQSNGMDTADIATLNDALGSAGVDLRAEEESLHRSNPYDQYQSYRSYEDRSHKQPAKPNFDARYLGATMRTIGTQHKVTKIPEDSVNYLALSLRARLQDLITAMIAASEHRTDTQFDHPASLYEDGSPMWSIVIRSDVGKQLAAIEKVEREDEMKIRRERKERAEAAAAAQSAAMASQGGMNMAADGMEDGEGGGPKKKKKKDGPGVTARNMSQDTQKKLSNAVAARAAGLSTGKYAWMTQANAAATAAKPKPTVTTSGAVGASGVTSPATTTAPAASATAGRWARPYVSTKTTQSAAQQKEEDTRRAITMRDAMFVIEKEKGHGGGRGSAKGWT